MVRRRFFPLRDDESNNFRVVFMPTKEGDIPTDVAHDANNVYVEMHVPGINTDHIDITVNKDQLRVSGEREESVEVADRDFYRKEIHYGSFERVISLPCPVDKDKALALCEEGVLKITLPKRRPEESATIKITKK